MKLAAFGLAVAFLPGMLQAEALLRDPTRPYVPVQNTPASSPRFVVNAIIISPQRRVAIVNGHRVSVGSSIGGATVTAIDKDRLVLAIGNKRITAMLNDTAAR
jgi:hypothetical protein